MIKKTNKKTEFVSAPIGRSYIEIFGSKEAVLTGKIEIIELGETVLKIKCYEHQISLKGDGLHIVNYEYDGITIKGEITGIEFEGG